MIKRNVKLEMSMLLKKAVYFASEKLDGQYRKGTKVPSFAHSVLVAFIVSKYSSDEKIIISAILHDVLEDCPNVTQEELEKIFGNKISEIINGVSIITDGGNKHKTWKDKKMAYIGQIEKVSKEALVIVAADKISNMKSYFEAVESGRDEVSKLFKGSLEEYFWYYNEILLVLKLRLKSHAIVREYAKILKYYQSRLHLKNNDN